MKRPRLLEPGAWPGPEDSQVLPPFPEVWTGIAFTFGARPEWFARLWAEHDNLRLASRRLVEAGRLDDAAGLWLAMVRFWLIRGLPGEATARSEETPT